MASYLSGLLTSTTSRYNNLRRSLLSDEADGDTENDSHISRVLRAYYTEKGRPLPEWLPPAAKPSGSSQNLRPGVPTSVPSQKSGRSTLSDLWDSPSQFSNSTSHVSSLRGSASRAVSGSSTTAGSSAPLPAGARLSPVGSRVSAGQTHGSNVYPDPSARPQSGAAGAAGSSAQDKLKAKLWGAPRP